MLPLSITFSSISGPKHQEFQVPAVANVAQLFQPTQIAVDWNSPSKFFDGALVTYAFSYAKCVPISFRVQGVVLKPSDRND